MTANQINYQKHLEDVRTHMAQEDETKRSHLMAESQRQQEIAVGQLQAQASMISAGAAAMNAQSNALNAQTNAAQVDLARQQLGETSRHNVAMEMETNRHNLQSEANETASTRSRILTGLMNVGGSLLR